MAEVISKLKTRLDIFHLPADRKELVEKNIREEAKGDLDFFVLCVLAGIIVSLGLIINSGAVIIGGMLVAPLFWPILAMALGIIKGSARLIQDSFFTVGKVLILLLVISYLIGLISPINEFDSEVLSRTQPTLFELFIALAAGFAGAFIISYPKLSHAIAGVVIAAALVPPICVIGLSLAERNLEAVGGSLLLFIANLIAVTVSAALFFLFARFKTLSYSSSEGNKKKNLAWSILTLIVICIPLVIITSNTILGFQRVGVVNKVIGINIPNSEVVETKINSIDDIYYIRATIRANQNIRQYKMDEISNELAHELDNSVNLKIFVIPVMEGGKFIEQKSVSIE
ncbi:MAG: TIGR00341 family protein [Candidatus Komeilibacteria bacterium]